MRYYNGMITALVLLVLSCFAVLAMNLRRIYGQVPIIELKRRANKGDQTAQCLYLVAHHGVTAERFLLGIVVISGALLAIVASRNLTVPGALLLILVFIGLLYVPLQRKNFRPADKAAQKLAPYLGRLFVRIRPSLQKINKFIKKHRPVTIHTGLYEKEDLMELIEKQKLASNNRIDLAELDIALHALKFGDKKVKDHMTPRRMIHFVGRDEPVGPVLMSELHESGFSRFPVTGTDENEVVGTLYLKNVVARTKPGIVSNIMSAKVYYVSDSASLEQVLDAFIKTKHHLFMVVNKFEEIIGLITIEDVIEQILGRKIVDEFDKYEDLRAVAELHAKADRAARK